MCSLQWIHLERKMIMIYFSDLMTGLGMCPSSEPDLAPRTLPLRVLHDNIRCELPLPGHPQSQRPALLQAVLHWRHLWQVPWLQQGANVYLELILYFSYHRPISDKALRALDHSWHVVCFVCKVDDELLDIWVLNFIYSQECGVSFEGKKSFYSVDGDPVCGQCLGNAGSY